MEPETVLIFVFFAVAFGIGAVVLGRSRGQKSAVLCFLAGFLFGPLGLLLILFDDRLERCPHCKSRLNRDATVCAACQREVTPTQSGRS